MKKWIKRIAFGLAVLISLVVVGAIAFVNTDVGRDEIRSQINNQLDGLFAGGGSIGKVEGSPFGEMILRDVVINAPDKKPAIKIGTLKLRIILLDLLKHDVQLRELTAEDVDASLLRDENGTLSISGLMKKKDEPPTKAPAEPESPSKWNLDFSHIQLNRAHVVYDSGLPDIKLINLDNVKLDGNFQLKANGDKHGKIVLGGDWREKGVKLSVQTELHDTAKEGLQVPGLALTLGDAAVTAKDVVVTMRDGKLPFVNGVFDIKAPAATVNKLYPKAELPADLAVKATVRGGKLTYANVAATVGEVPVTASVVADIDQNHATGTIDIGDLDVAKLTKGKIQLSGAGGTIAFDAMPGKDGELPIATARIAAHGQYGKIPRAELVANVATHGDRVATTAVVTGPADATITADLEKNANELLVHSATVVATVLDPERASGGMAPVHGRLDVNLHASGEVSPTPSLALAGTINGRALRYQDAVIGGTSIALDARDLPAHPQGTASITLSDLQKGANKLKLLAIKAGTRADGRVAVDVYSKPQDDPWLVELGALVTLPDANGTALVDINRHHVRAGNGVDWVGNSGRVVIAANRIDVRGLASNSPEGKLAVEGSFGRQSGDLTAKVDVESFALAAVKPGLLGTIAAHVDVARNGGRWTGNVALKGAGLGAVTDKPTVDLDAKLTAAPGKVTLDAVATNQKLGGVKLAVDLDAPQRLEDVNAWKTKGQAVVRSAQLQFQKIDLGQLAAIAGQPKTSGTLEGELDFSPSKLGGALHVRKLQSPALRGVKFVDADFTLDQKGPQELDPQLVVALADIGKITAQAQIAMPKELTDLAAWKQQGVKSLQGALITTDKINFDPAFWDRLGIASNFRGVGHLQVEVAQGASAVNATVAMEHVRGTPIAQPVNITLTAALGAKDATAAVTMKTENGTPVSLMQVDGSIALPLDKLRENPQLARTMPLNVKIDLPKSSAPLLLNVFGRPEVTAGNLDGHIEVAGTLARPTIKGKVAMTDLELPPGPRGKPVQKVKSLTVDLGWDPDKGGSIAVDGLEDNGGTLAIRAQGSPTDLAKATAKVTAKKFNFTPLLVFAPGPAGASKGTLDANLDIKGFDLKTAQIAGDLHIADARIPIAPQIGTLRQANIDISIRQHDIKINANGKLGPGTVKMQGAIALDGASLTGGNATITVRKVSPIGAIQPVVDADITAKIARKGTAWTADVVIDHAFVKVSTKTGEAIKPVGLPADVAIGRGKQPAKADPKQQIAPPEAPSFFATITLHNAKVEADEFRTTVRGTIKATADAKGLGMEGGLEAVGGNLDLFDHRYRIEEAKVQFDGTVDPILGVRITHDFPDVETITEVRGRLSKPQLILSANPGNYTNDQLLGFLLGGEPGGDPTSGSARDKAQNAGTGFIAGQIAGQIKKVLPVAIDVIKYEAASASSSAAITVGSWITHTLFFAFSEHLDPRPDENSGEATIEYWFTKRLEVQGTAGDRNFDGIDMLWRKRF